jgi:hypothetical protein
MNWRETMARALKFFKWLKVPHSIIFIGTSDTGEKAKCANPCYWMIACQTSSD